MAAREVSSIALIVGQALIGLYCFGLSLLGVAWLWDHRGQAVAQWFVRVQLVVWSPLAVALIAHLAVRRRAA